MEFSICYFTRYEYVADVVENINALRVKPIVNSRQRVDSFSVRLTPEVRQHHHEDYFGTEVVEFEVVRPHRELVIDVRARVHTESPPTPTGTTWEALRHQIYRETGSEFLVQTDDAPGHPLLAELAAAVGAVETPLAAVLLVSELIPSRFEYRRGATYVDSPIEHLLDGVAGVCQDFVHLGLNLLRTHGIAARYVSGYLFTTGGEPADGADGAGSESVEVDTHAWIEALLPGESETDEPFWVAIDPTNRGLTGQCHIKIGHGRHYADVPPIKGVYRGTAAATLEASVTMTRLDRPEPAGAARD